MCKLTFIDLQDKATLPPLELPVWLVFGDSMYIGCRTAIVDNEEDGMVWLWGLCDYYLISDKWNSGYIWKCSDVDVDDYSPTAWMELPNLQDLLTQTY
jgi:hypothetical protein